MKQNITPADRMKKGMRRSLKFLIWLIIGVTVAGGISGVVLAHYLPNPEQSDQEVRASDTLQMNAGDLSRDSVLDSMKATPVGREYDSVVKRRDRL